jgi:hypothetical protein
MVNQKLYNTALYLGFPLVGLTFSTHGKPRILNMHNNLVKLSHFYRYPASKRAKMTDHSKENAQLDVYTLSKMAKNHGIHNKPH